MHQTEWSEVAEYVAAGNLDSIKIGEDFDSVEIEVVYLGVATDRKQTRADIHIQCLNCCYMDLRRQDDHEPGPGNILEAYLHTESTLLTDLRNHKLDGKSGCLRFEHEGKPVYHLEIVGEVSLNLICEEATVRWNGLSHQRTSKQSISLSEMP